MLQADRFERCAVMASGASLSAADCEAASRLGLRSITTNLSFRLAPWADLAYGCDGKFWDRHIAEARAVCSGTLVTQDAAAAERHGISRVASVASPGISPHPAEIALGGYRGSRSNSGYQAIGLAIALGAREIVLLGMDMHGGHWHGEHGPGLDEELPFGEWLAAFPQLARDAEARGIRITNCTPGSAIDCLPRARLSDLH